MKCTISQPDLSAALQAASRAVAARPALDALGCVLLEATPEGLRVTGTDLNLTVSVVASAKVERPGTIAVPARMLSSFVASLVPGDCSLEVKPSSQPAPNGGPPVGSLLALTAGAHRSNFHGLPATEFPPITKEDRRTICSCDPVTLQQMVAQVQASAESDEDNLMSGILVEAEENRLRLVASDRARLSMRTLPLAQAIEKATRVVLPGRHLRTIAQSLRHPGEEVTIWVTQTGNAIGFTQERLEITSRLLEGTFPPYERVFAGTQVAHAIVGREELLAAVRTAAIIADGKREHFRLLIAPQSVTVCSALADAGDDEAPVPAETDGESLELAYNPRFLMDTLQQVTTERIDMTFASRGPTIFRPVGRDDFAAVLMPITLPAAS
jgi:DNA polymerase-3 subunit beta